MLQAQNRFEMMREYWRERFLETDQARLIEQFHLAADDQYIYVTITVKPLTNRGRKAQKVHLRQNQRGI